MPAPKEPKDDQIDGNQDDPMEDEFEPEEGGRFIGDIYIPPPPPAACTMENKGPRLIITHIENYFFKSYANTQVLGPFHKSFTSIVGPNGSGKSNVIDSMLFVFGYRAQKIRSKKLSVLLHNSDRYPDVQTGSVTVYFQYIIDKDGDEFDPVPDSKFSVSRTVNKDNSSFYQINNRKVQFKEVAKLLRSHGIDLDHNRFLILQGEVEQIAMMKPKGQGENDCGMLEYLEDIIGSSRYKQPLEILDKRVEEFSELRIEKLNRLKVVEKEKDDLEGPKNEAIKYLEEENDLARERNKLYQCYIFKSNNEIMEAEEAKKQEMEAMKELLDALQEAKNQREEKEKAMDQLKKEMEKGKKRQDELNNEFSKLTTEDEKISQDQKIANDQRKKLKKNIEEEKKKATDLKDKLENNGSKIAEIQQVRDKADEERKVLDGEVSKLMKETKSETEGIQKEKDKVEMELISLRESVQEAEQNVQLAKSGLEIYMSTYEKSKGDLESGRKDLEAASELRKTRKEAVEELQSEVPQNEREFGDAQNRINVLRQQEEKLITELRAKKAKLDEDRSAMQSAKSNNRIVDALMEEKRKGTMPGIFGRLGDLGAIDPKYDVAISTACGQLEYIVTDNMETAQQAVNFLKKHNLGVTTCLDLEKQEEFREIMHKSNRFPENVPRLFDLVQVKDERVRTAFYFALRDTLVANDLEQARRIAFGGRERYRVVTLTGDVIEMVGTMSGGGNRVIRGRMGQQVRTDTSRDLHASADDMKKLESDVERLSSALNVVRTDIRRLEDSCMTLEKRIKDGKQKLQKFLMEMGALEEREKSLKNRVSECEKKLAESVIDKNKVKELEKDIKNKEKILENALSKAKVIEDKVKEFDNQINAITNKKLKPAQKRLEDANKKWEKLKTELSKLNAELTSAKRNLPKSENKIADWEQELTEKENEIRANAEKRKWIEEKGREVLAETEVVTQKNSEVDDQLKAAKAEYDKTQKEENKFKAQKIDLDNKLDKYNTAIKENNGRIKHFNKEIEKLNIQEIPGKEVEPLKKLEEEELKRIDPKGTSTRITYLEEQLGRQPPNMNVLAEYKRKEEIYLERVKELDEITGKRDEARKHVDELKKARLNEFMSGFEIITTKLKEMYQMITLGGDAELELVDSLDPFTEGIVFSVRPPKKSWKNISNLSGGEKTLSSLALVFALHYYKPTPLYVMDEIDAALDFKNVSIVGNYVKERTKNAQFIIISLRSQMFELADRLVGIYKTHNCTKSTTINPHLIGRRVEEEEERSA